MNAAALGVDGKTILHFLDLLIDLLLVRQLQPLVANAGKRLVKAPKVYVRDSGLVHTLLALDRADAVLDHPSGQRWAIEVKRSLTPVLSKGFHQARADLDPHTVLW